MTHICFVFVLLWNPSRYADDWIDLHLFLTSFNTKECNQNGYVRHPKASGPLHVFKSRVWHTLIIITYIFILYENTFSYFA
jgi:hypothetical protein